MSRLFVIVPVIAVALDIFSIIDIITIDERRVRGLLKVLWVAIGYVLFSIAWRAAIKRFSAVGA